MKVTIIGMDVLGQSLGMALKASQAEITILAHDRNHERASDAVKQGAADRSQWNLLNAVAEADLIFINEPIYQIRETLQAIGPELQPDTVITDTSSSKGQVLQWSQELLPESVHFVGGTPFVTSTEPTPFLFQGEHYAVVSLPSTAESALRLLTNVITVLGAKPFFMGVEEHDSFAAAVKYLPTLTSAALLQLAAQSTAWREMEAVSGPTFARATVLPTRDPKELAALLCYSREPLLRWLDALQGELMGLERMLRAPDGGADLEEHLREVVEAQLRWQAVRAESGESTRYHKALDEAKEQSPLKRLFTFGKRRE